MSTPLQQAVSAYMDANGGGDGLFPTAVDGLTLMRASRQSLPGHMLYRPELCVVVQGAKSIMLGEVVLDYREMQALVAGVELPGVGQVLEASPARPLLVMALELDVPLLRETMKQVAAGPSPALGHGHARGHGRGHGDGLGVYVHDIGPALAACLQRLIDLLATPHEIPVLLPLLLREIYYRLLTGPNGDKLFTLGMPESRMRRVADALHLLRTNFSRPVRIEELAAAAGMSASSFHQHFKQLTSMTPLAYQKNLRLLEAKRLMVMEQANVSRAAFHVGYESASQFSRDYVRRFGIPPKRDADAARVLYRVHDAKSA